MDAIRRRFERSEFAPHLEPRTVRLSFFRQCLNQMRPLDYEVGAIEGNGGRTSVGKQFESLNFIDNRTIGDGAEKRAHAVGDDQSARGGIPPLGAFENPYRAARTGEKRRCEQARSRAAYDRDGKVWWRRLPFIRRLQVVIPLRVAVAAANKQRPSL